MRNKIKCVCLVGCIVVALAGWCLFAYKAVFINREKAHEYKYNWVNQISGKEFWCSQNSSEPPFLSEKSKCFTIINGKDNLSPLFYCLSYSSDGIKTTIYSINERPSLPLWFDEPFILSASKNIRLLSNSFACINGKYTTFKKSNVIYGFNNSYITLLLLPPSEQLENEGVPNYINNPKTAQSDKAITSTLKIMYPKIANIVRTSETKYQLIPIKFISSLVLSEKFMFNGCESCLILKIDGKPKGFPQSKENLINIVCKACIVPTTDLLHIDSSSDIKKLFDSSEFYVDYNYSSILSVNEQGAVIIQKPSHVKVAYKENDSSGIAIKFSCITPSTIKDRCTFTISVSAGYVSKKKSFTSELSKFSSGDFSVADIVTQTIIGNVEFVK